MIFLSAIARKIINTMARGCINLADMSKLLSSLASPGKELQDSTLYFMNTLMVQKKLLQVRRIISPIF